MRSRVFGHACGLAIMGATALSHGSIVRCRFVDPDHNNAPYPDVLDATPGREYRVRVQMGVFEDGEHDNQGGLLGWNIGRIDSVQGTMRRSPGRLAPFTFASDMPGNGLPSQDPFFALSDIDATIGLQSMTWLPGRAMPQPVVRGLEQYVSIFEFTVPIDAEQTRGFSIEIHGNAVGASGWFPLGTPIPPEDEEPGVVLYAPMPTRPEPIYRRMEVRIVPTGSSAVVVAVGLIRPWRRSRKRLAPELGHFPLDAG